MNDETNRTYRYYLKLRPPFIGTHPAGAVVVEGFDRMLEVAPGLHAWGYVDYEKPLTPDEIEHFGLAEVDG